MKKILISILFAVVLLSGCTINNQSENKNGGNDSKIEKSKDTDKGKDNKAESLKDTKEGNESKVGSGEDAEEGNMSPSSNKLIEFVGTYCPHCQASVPVLQKFYKEHEGVNIELNVIDRKPFPGVVKLPQNYTDPKDISEYTNEQCGYVPSYVFLDKNGQVLDYRCGGSPSDKLMEKYLLKNGGDENSESGENGNQQANGIGNLDNNNREMKNGKPAEVRLGDEVSVNYIGTFDDGKVFDTSIEEEAKKADIYSEQRKYGPLKFVVGGGNMIKCFDKGIIGMKIGETKDISCSSDEAYGPCKEEYSKVIKKEQLKAIEEEGGQIKVGIQVSNGMQVGTITKIEGDNVTIDFNSPMCGKNLNFKVTVEDIQA